MIFNNNLKYTDRICFEMIDIVSIVKLIYSIFLI